MPNTVYVRSVLLILFKGNVCTIFKSDWTKKEIHDSKTMVLNVNHPLQSAQQLLSAMQKYTGNSKHSTEKNHGKSRSLGSGRSKMHKLFHSKLKLNKTTLFKKLQYWQTCGGTCLLFWSGDATYTACAYA